MRTIQKVASTFDYVGRPPGGKGLVDLEFKGTVDNASVKAHRASFRDKLATSNRLGPPQQRGYEQAVGVIFCGWTHGSGGKRSADFEVMDPGESGGPQAEDAAREVIRYYAARYDEVVGMAEAAERLLAVAERPDLFDGGTDIRDLVGSGGPPGRFSRAALRVEGDGYGATYWGGFWEAEWVPHPSVVIGGHSSREFHLAYVGIDREIIQSIRAREFGQLLEYRSRAESFKLMQDGECAGIGLLISDGTVLLWSRETPPLEIVVEPA